MVVKKGNPKSSRYRCRGNGCQFSKITCTADIERVAAISAGDESVGKLIGEAMEKVTADGVITIEESKTAETYSEVVEGMQFDRGYITPYMVTDTDKMEAVIDDAYILITDKKISAVQEILPCWSRSFRQGQETGYHCRGISRRSPVYSDCQ